MSDEGRAPVWRRLGAAAIDGVFVLIAASLLSVALYTASGGKVRAFVFQPVVQCGPGETVPSSVAKAAGAALPEFRAAEAMSCRRLFLGLESSRYMVVRMAPRHEDARDRGVFVMQPVNRAGEAVQPMSLGWVYPLLFVLSMAAGEGLLGGTPGKAGLGLRVVAAAGGRLGLGRALWRNLAIYGWLAAGALLVLVLPHLGRAAPGLGAFARQLWIAELAVVGALALWSLAMLLMGRPDPAYDRWTRAKVVRA